MGDGRIFLKSRRVVSFKKSAWQKFLQLAIFLAKETFREGDFEKVIYFMASPICESTEGPFRGYLSKVDRL
jgi:hypothetical protein